MRKKDPDKIIKDLNDYRLDGDRQRVLDEIDSFMEVESVDDARATVKHAYLGFVPDDSDVNRLTCDVATWKMQWDKQAACWVVDDWSPVDTFFQIDVIKGHIPWEKIRGLLFETDEECAEAIADDAGFQNFYADTVADMDLDDDTSMHSVIRDPLLRKALTPEEE